MVKNDFSSNNHRYVNIKGNSNVQKRYPNGEGFNLDKRCHNNSFSKYVHIANPATQNTSSQSMVNGTATTNDENMMDEQNPSAICPHLQKKVKSLNDFN